MSAATSRMTWVTSGCGRSSFLSASSSLQGGSTVGSLSGKDPIMPQGTVKFFNEMKGFGFITPDGGGQDAFVHISAVEQAGLRTLNNDQRVEYELAPDKRGRESATNLKAL